MLARAARRRTIRASRALAQHPGPADVATGGNRLPIQLPGLTIWERASFRCITAHACGDVAPVRAPARRVMMARVPVSMYADRQGYYRGWIKRTDRSAPLDIIESVPPCRC